MRWRGPARLFPARARLGPASAAGRPLTLKYNILVETVVPRPGDAPEAPEPDVDEDDLGLEEEEVVAPVVPVAGDPAEPTEDVSRYRMPDTRNREMFAIADELMGASKIKAMCEDGKS